MTHLGAARQAGHGHVTGTGSYSYRQHQESRRGPGPDDAPANQPALAGNGGLQEDVARWRAGHPIGEAIAVAQTGGLQKEAPPLATASLSQAPHFAESGTSPPRSRRRRVPPRSQRYLAHISYSIVREGEPAVRDRIETPELAAAVARRVIPDDGREHFVVLLLDSQNRLTAHHHVSTGSLSVFIVHPREALGPALREGAAHLLIAHNHPSGDPTPSREDIQLTRQLAEGARLLGLRLHDHIITGSGTEAFVSFNARGLLS
jgi:DNA repair protein RadC